MNNNKKCHYLRCGHVCDLLLHVCVCCASYHRSANLICLSINPDGAELRLSLVGVPTFID